jgi:hypothetical protein
MISSMTRPTTSSKVLLVGDRRGEADTSAGTPVRRYRLARLRFDDRPSAPGARFDHLKRVYD